MLSDLRGAFAFLTVLPVGNVIGQPGRTFAYYPLVGLVIGALLSLVASTRVLSPDLTAFAVLVFWIILTGGLHLDGFGDSCDGLLSAMTPERRLEIMKDPRAGSWAVVGLVLLLLGKWLALRQVAPLLMILPPVLGRWAMVFAAQHFPYARSTGLGAYFRDGLGQRQLVIATVLALLFALPLIAVFGLHPLLALFMTPLLVIVVGQWAASRLGGGLTGDVYGALCELTELLCLLMLSTH
jgi:adenosylcobinamide-GDP ribazoletransferase